MTHRCCCGGGALLLPSLETQVEDEDAERKEEEDVCDGEGGEDEGARSSAEAIHIKREEGVGGEKVSMKKGVIGGGERGVDRHI